MAVDVQIFISSVLIFGGLIWDSPLLKLMLKRNLRCVHNRIPTTGTNPPVRLIRRWSFWWISQDSDWYKWYEPPDPNSFETKAYPYPIKHSGPWTKRFGQRGSGDNLRGSLSDGPKKGSLGNDCHTVALQLLAGETKIIWGNENHLQKCWPAADMVVSRTVISCLVTVGK